MSNDSINSDQSSSEVIDVTVEANVQQWALKLDTTAAQIRQAVADVGNLAADVEMHLKGSHSTTNADQARRA